MESRRPDGIVYDPPLTPASKTARGV